MGYRRLVHTGFTLIELLVVIAIIGALATIGLITLHGAGKTKKIEEAKSELNMLRLSIMQYKMNSQGVCIAKDGNVKNPATPTNPEIIKTLTSPDKKGGTLLGSFSRRNMDSNGNYLDPWGTSYIFIAIGKKIENKRVITDVYVFSAGPDKMETISTIAEWNEYPASGPAPTSPSDNDNVYPD
jgi:prepilin-type N-terminal cleavage/methylation domain-containing protein